MIISKCDDDTTIYSSWRIDGKKVENRVAQIPYFFILDEERERASYSVGKYLQRDFSYQRGEYYSLEGAKLKKVFVEKQSDIYEAKKSFSQTFEADVPLHFRYCVDNLESIPEYKMRKWYWDMEWQQGGEYDGCITTIVAYDNYDEKYYQWIWLPINEQLDTVFDTGVRFIFDNEKEMLENFIATMVDKDPDMLIAWFGSKFDLPKLLERCAFSNIDPRIISPINFVKGIKEKRGNITYTKQGGYSAIEQAIGGRITLDLDLAFERQWNDAQKGTLPSLSLEYVSNLLFGEGKVKESKFTDKNEFFEKAWLEDTEVYLEYALKDVELIVRLDEENFCSESILALQRLLIAPFDACFYASHMGSIYFMRNANWKAKTGSKVDKRVEYDGAMIYHPLDEGTNGLHHNVAAFDFAGLYPSMIIARNISFETKSTEPTKFVCDLNTPRHLKDVEWEKNLRYFKTDKLGLLPKALLELKELRKEYKKNMKLAETKEEKSKWNNNQMAVKRLMASFYGILAFQGFGWSDVDLAASITASARESIRFVAKKAKEMK